MSQPARISSLALAVAALALAPASAHATNGGAAAPSATAHASGGAAPGALARSRSRAVARAPRRSRARTRRPKAPARPPPAAPAPPTAHATLRPDGTAAAPAGAPAAVVAVIAAGNRIASLPYKWGGGHATWDDTGYDCSGSVGYALHGGGLLDVSETSGELTTYGSSGHGAWITLYANADHVYMVVAGLRFDTSGASPSRWQAAPRSASGFTVRHPTGL